MPVNQSVNQYKTSASHTKGVKKWARRVRKDAELGWVSRTEMIVVQSLVRRHLRVLMCRESDSSPIPPSISQEQEKNLIDNFPEGAPLPHANSVPLVSVTDFVQTGPHMKSTDFIEVESDLMRWGLRRFTFNWEAGLDNRANHLARELFWISFYRATKLRSYKFKISPHVLGLEVVYPVFNAEFKRLRSKYRTQCSSLEVLEYHSMVQAKEQVCKEYRECLMEQGSKKELVSIFQPRNCFLLGTVSEIELKAGDVVSKEIHVTIPRWWSDKTLKFVQVIEHRLQLQSKSRNIVPGSVRPNRKYIKSDSLDYGFVPRHLPADLYSDEYKESLLPNELVNYKMKPSVLPPIYNMDAIFPTDKAQLVNHSFDKAVNEYYPSDEDVSADELIESEDEDTHKTTEEDVSELKRVKDVFQTELLNLKGDITSSKTRFTTFQNDISQQIPVRLAELQKAKDDIATLNNKLNEIQEKLNSNKGASSSGGNRD